MEKITMVEYGSTTAAGSARFLSEVFGWTATTYGPQYTDLTAFPGGGRFHFREPGGNELAVGTPDAR